MIEVFIDVTLLAFLAITAVAIVRMTNLFAIVMLFGIFSFLSAAMFVVMDAVDVAFTEAAVGAGISTVLMFCKHCTDQRVQRKKICQPSPLVAAGGSHYDWRCISLWYSGYSCIW